MSARARHVILPSSDEPERRACSMVLVSVALSRIDAAQGLLGEAAEALSPIRGLAGEWNAACAHVDRLREFWFRLDDKRSRGKFTLDRPAAEFQVKNTIRPTDPPDMKTLALQACVRVLADLKEAGGRLTLDKVALDHIEFALAKAEAVGLRP